MQECTERLPATTIAKQIIPGEPRLLIDAAQEHFAAPEFRQARSILAQRAATILGQSGSDRPEAEGLFLQGQCHAIQDRPRQAVDCMRRALQIEPRNCPWRFRLAKYLAAIDQVPEALKESRVCVAMQPDNPHYVNLERELVQRTLRQPSTGTRKQTVPSNAIKGSNQVP